MIVPLLLSIVLKAKVAPPQPGRCVSLRYVSPLKFDFSQLPQSVENLTVYVGGDQASPQPTAPDLAWALYAHAKQNSEGKTEFLRSATDLAEIEKEAGNKRVAAFNALLAAPSFANSPAQPDLKQSLSNLEAHLRRIGLDRRNHRETPGDYAYNIFQGQPIGFYLKKFLQENRKVFENGALGKLPLMVSNEKQFNRTDRVALTSGFVNQIESSTREFASLAQQDDLLSLQRQTGAVFRPMDVVADTTETPIVLFNAAESRAGIVFSLTSYSSNGNQIEGAQLTAPLADAFDRSIEAKLSSVNITLSLHAVSWLRGAMTLFGIRNSTTSETDGAQLPAVTLHDFESNEARDVLNPGLNEAIPAMAKALGDSRIVCVLPDSALSALLNSWHGRTINLGQFYRNLSQSCEIDSTGGELKIRPEDIIRAENAAVNRIALKRAAEEMAKTGDCTFRETDALLSHIWPSDRYPTLLSYYMYRSLIIIHSSYQWRQLPSVSTYWLLSKIPSISEEGAHNGSLTFLYSEKDGADAHYERALATSAASIAYFQTPPLPALVATPVYTMFGTSSSEVRYHVVTSYQDELTPVLNGKVEAEESPADFGAAVASGERRASYVEQYVKTHYRFLLVHRLVIQGTVQFPSGLNLPIEAGDVFLRPQEVSFPELPDECRQEINSAYRKQPFVIP